MMRERKVETIRMMVAEKTEWRCDGRSKAKPRRHTVDLDFGGSAGLEDN